VGHGLLGLILAPPLSNFHEPCPPLSFTGEYLIYRETWVMQYHGKATWWRPLLVSSREPLRGPQEGPRAPFEKPWFRKCNLKE